MTESVVVPASLAYERIDRIVALLSGRSRAEVAELISSGAVQIDGEPVTVRHRRVAGGESLVMNLGERPVPVVPPPAVVGTIPFSVVYEDDALIVVDKPAGVVVHPGAGHRDDTLVSGLVGMFPDLHDAGTLGGLDPTRPGIVHRLDKDTSGLIVIARNALAERALVGQLKTRTMGRRYRALVVGLVTSDSGLIEAPIGRSARDRTRMAVQSDGREARTHYEVLRRFHGPTLASEIRASLETGRTHQIRVHFSAIGHPVVGDRRYGGTLSDLKMSRPFLHAEQLTLVHPVREEEMTFFSPLPDELTDILDRLVLAEEQ